MSPLWARSSTDKEESFFGEAMHENIKRVGLPIWSDADQTLARALQRELKMPEKGLATKVPQMRMPRSNRKKMKAGTLLFALVSN